MYNIRYYIAPAAVRIVKTTPKMWFDNNLYYYYYYYCQSKWRAAESLRIEKNILLCLRHVWWCLWNDVRRWNHNKHAYHYYYYYFNTKQLSTLVKFRVFDILFTIRHLVIYSLCRYTVLYIPTIWYRQIYFRMTAMTVQIRSF